MRRLGLAVAAALVLGVPVVARASAANCPAGVATATGTNPSYADISTLLTNAAASDPNLPIPPQVLKAIAYQESEWRQYDDAGHVVISSDTVCGVGIMQVTASDSSDPQRLATDIAFNIAEGARILRAKWTISQSSVNPGDTNAPDDPTVTENWYYPVCRYNGCGTVKTYPDRVSQTAADPFRRVVNAAIKPYMPIGGFTSPYDVKPGYALAQPFQARVNPSVFVFYDPATGNVTDTIAAPTHDFRDPPPVVTYGAGTYGPDGPGVACSVSCAGWRLAETRGIAGRAHWTLSQATQGTRIDWTPALPRTATYRIWTYVPAVGTAANPLGTATYHLGSSSYAVDQAAIGADHWAPLGDHTLSPGASLWVDDVSGTIGRTIAADAARFSAVTALDLTASTAVLSYGQPVTLTAHLAYAGTATDVSGATVRLYRRATNVATWTYAGAAATGGDGRAAFSVAPAANTYYQVRFTSPSTDVTSSTSVTRRVDVRPRVTARLSRTTAPRNVAATLSVAVSPSHAGQSVQLQRYYYGAWHTIATKPLGSSSITTFSVSGSVAGSYVYRVVKPADADHVTGWSASVTLQVT